MNNKSSDYSFNPYKDTLLSHQFDRLFLLITTETATNLQWQLPAWENGILVKPKKAIKFKSGTTLYKDAIYLAYKEDNDQYIVYDPISGWKVGINSDKLSILPVD